MREFFRSLVSRVLEHPFQFLLKPAIKSAVAIGLLTVAAQTVYERSVDRHGMAALAKAAMKGSSKSSATRR